MKGRIDILLAEDDESDVLLFRRAFRDAQLQPTIEVARDGQEAIEWLERRTQSENDTMPALVILDLKMPRRGGMDVLRWMRRQRAMSCLPVFIFSSSAHREDIECAYANGANAFLVKPPSTVLRAEFARFIGEWLRLNQPPLAATDGFRATHALHVARNYDRGI
jgi:CheY-like chemotaxis protein